jgi:hypothetical protein
MNKAAYTQLLTQEERAAGIRAGAALISKQAAFSPTQAAGNVMKAIAATALITGIPIGIAAHLVGRHISGDRLRERELKERIGYFRDATSTMERGLAANAPA